MMRKVVEQVGRNRGYYVVLALAAVVVLALNCLTTLKGDEYVYALLPDLSGRCATLGDYIRSVPAFYCDTNGRLADALVRLFSSLVGKPLFNVLNSLVFVLFVEGIFTLAVGRRRSVVALAIVLVLIAVAFPFPGETMMWMAGSFNYLWSSTLSLWLLCCLHRLRPHASPGIHVGVACAAFVAGGFNEGTSLAVLAGVMGYFLFNRMRLTGVHRTALLAYTLGVVMIFMSPNLWIRLGGSGSVNLSLSVAQLLSRRVLLLGYMSLRFVTPVVALVVMVHHWRHHGRWRGVVSRPDFCLLIGAILTAFALGMIIERPYMFLVSVSTAIVLRTFWVQVHSMPRRRQVAVTTVCLMLVAVGSVVTIYKVWQYYNYDKQVVVQMASGPRQCILPAAQSPVSSRWIVEDVYDNGAYNCAYRTIYCHYFDKDNIQFLPRHLYRRYQDGTLLDGVVPQPFESDDPAWATTVLAAPGQNYALIPLQEGFTPDNGKGKVWRTDIVDYWGKTAYQRRYWLGSYLDYVPVRPYWLLIDGRAYQVIDSPIVPQVTTIEVEYNRDGEPRVCTFTRIGHQ